MPHTAPPTTTNSDVYAWRCYGTISPRRRHTGEDLGTTHTRTGWWRNLSTFPTREGLRVVLPQRVTGDAGVLLPHGLHDGMTVV